MAYMIKQGRAYDTDLARSFDSVVQRVFGSAGVNLSPSPAVDVREEDDQYVIEVELPGYSRNDVDIHVKEGVLSVASVDETNGDGDTDGTVDKTRRHSFSRRVSLPKDVNRDAIEALFTNGLLEITLNKQPEAKPRQIEIQVN